MTGEQTVDYVKQLSGKDLIALREEAGRGIPNAVALWVAYAAVRKCLKEGWGTDFLAEILNRTSIKVEMV